MPERASKRGRGGSTAGTESQRGAGHAELEPSLQFKPEPSNFAAGRHDPLSSAPSIQPQLPEQPFQQDLGLYFARPGKMLLPPLPRAQGAYSSSSKSEKFRTSHACNTCRKAKAKCSGGMPCDKCRNEDKECVYGEGKRDKERKEMERILHQNRKMVQKREQLVSTLWTFASDLAPNMRRELEEILMSPRFSIEEDEDQVASIGSDKRDSETQESIDHGEDDANAEVGSPGSLDVINEDTNRDENARAAGFMGKSSAVSWVQRAKRAASNTFWDEENVHGNIGTALKEPYTNSSYHAEPSSNITVETDEVNPFEWPATTVAKALVDLYFEHVHVAFPIISKRDFYATFESYPRSRITQEEHIWLSLANMVFAMGAIFAHMTHADFRGDERDHHVYYARARALGMDQRSLNKDPELQHIACLGVLGLYLLSADQLNRSWTICGIAIRHATALGLHVRSEAKELNDTDKEFRVRLWWSVYSLERVLDELTGRPSCISDRDISTPLPINVDEADFSRDRVLYESRPTLHDPGRGKAKFAEAELPTPVESTSPSKVPSQQSGSPLASTPLASFSFPMTRLSITSSTYFIYRTQLSIICHEILAQLYSASLVKAKWSGVQETIRRVDARLLQWKSSLPEELDFSSKTPTQIEGYEIHRTSLAMFYNSSRMILFRPCLCHGRRIERQSERSKSFDTNAAITCIQSARNIIAALPNIEEPTRLYLITAWWDTIHYIIEAASVLMLELAYRAEHLPSRAEDILTDSKTAVMWLRAMSDQSIAARKGWEIFASLLNLVAPKVGGDTCNMPTTAPEPPGWKKKGSEGRIHNEYGSEYRSAQQDYTSDPNRMTDWVDQSTYASQQGYSASATMPVDIYARENGLPSNFLTPLYPFHHIYGRYGEYPPSENIFYPTSTYPGTTSLVAESLGTMTSQIGTLEPYNYGDINEFVETKYEPSGAGKQDYNMTGYHSWGDSNAAGNQGPYGGGPS